jgi:lysine N6-hydroxylase
MIMPHQEYDIVGIGIGPFNLGLAALGASVSELRMRFFERTPRFDWHPGMLIEGTSLQVSFIADLVTMADPCNRFSFLSYLKDSGRLYQFAIRDNNFVGRNEYNLYCQWVARQLPSLEFGTEVTAVRHDPESDGYLVETRSSRPGAGASSSRPRCVRARNVVLGVGSVPRLPSCVPREPATRIFHSAEYLRHRASALASRSVTLIGSGQSAAEIFHDLVQSKGPDGVVTWFTRAERFFPMEYSALTLEMASPDYIDHFYGLRPQVRADVLSRQDALYKGISFGLINRIYDLLYERTVTGDRGDVRMSTNCELRSVDAASRQLALTFRHRELDREFTHHTDALILATGYEYRVPGFLEPLRDHIRWDEHGRYVIRRDYSLACAHGGLFVQNAELHTHGFTASDLSIGPYRNGTILNNVLGREQFRLERRIAFQDFGLPREPATGLDREPPRERHGDAPRPASAPPPSAPPARAVTSASGGALEREW